MKQSEKIFIYILILTLLSVLRCGQKGTRIKVQNSSGNNLSKIIISGNGFSNTIPKLKDNESRSIQVFPKGESSLTVQFISNGQEYKLPQDTYFEGTGQYSVLVEIQPDLTVTVDVKI